MNIEDLGTISYGNLKFEFSSSGSVLNYFRSRGISSEELLVSSQTFYKTICYKLDLDYDEDKIVEIVFWGVGFEEDSVSDRVSGYMDFIAFPLDISDKTFFVSFGARVK